MAQKHRESHEGRQAELAAEHYYDYEARFVKQKREQERINVLPRVIKPAMFAKGEFALGDMRVFSRYTVAPLSSLTCGFVELKPGAQSDLKRMIPSAIVYILDGSGESIQENARFSFKTGDVVIIPPYTTHQFVANSDEGFRAWLPQVRIWHGQGLLWREQLEADREREAIFQTRRRVRITSATRTRYDWFLARLAEENRIEREAPRVIRGTDCSWESTRQGKLKFYISRWTEVAAAALDLMMQEIRPGEHSGEHRHIFEELLLVVKGRGYDLHEGTRHPWEAGDLICIPPMISHQHVNDGTDTAQLISVWSRQPGHEYLGGIEQISDASDWIR
jgi:gentisate 1,2-dioxygenase